MRDGEARRLPWNRKSNLYVHMLLSRKWKYICNSLRLVSGLPGWNNWSAFPLFQGPHARVVHEIFRTFVCSRSCQDPRLFLSSERRKQRHQVQVITEAAPLCPPSHLPGVGSRSPCQASEARVLRLIPKQNCKLEHKNRL